MRVAFLVHCFPVLSETFIQNAATGLLAAGHEVDIYALDGQASGPEPAFGPRVLTPRHRFRPKQRALALPGTLWRLVNQHGPKAMRALDRHSFGPDGQTLRAAELAALWQHNGHYDVIHCQFATLADLALDHRRAGFLSGPILVHFRGYDVSEALQTRGPTAYARLLSEADGFAAPCQYFLDRMIGFGADPDKCAVVPSAVNTANFTFAPRCWAPGQALNLLAVGRLVEKKGFAFVLSGLAHLVRQGIPARLELIGDGPLRAELEQTANTFGIASHVHFLGAQPQHMVAARLQEAHIFVGPSHRARNGDEDGIINTLKEAMLSGCPFLTTDHAGMPELVKGVDAGVMVAQGQAEAVHQGLDLLLRRHRDWPEMGQSGRDHILATQSIEAATASLLQTYQATRNRHAQTRHTSPATKSAAA